MPLALDLVGADGAQNRPADLRLAPAPPLVPLDVIPAQSGRFLTISLTEGCEAPLEALKTSPPNRAVRCHPCDQAIVLLLLSRARRDTETLVVSPAILPGTLRLG